MVEVDHNSRYSSHHLTKVSVWRQESQWMAALANNFMLCGWLFDVFKDRMIRQQSWLQGSSYEAHGRVQQSVYVQIDSVTEKPRARFSGCWKNKYILSF